MDAIVYYIRKLIKIFRTEILVLPSRILVMVFVVTLAALPVILNDPYIGTFYQALPGR
jgi:hypothetical protein